MKVQCDVCNKEEASMFCSADDAALCSGCDRKVHHANKLAEKHTRFSLLNPSFKESPICDICQERKAFLFCQEDRAILCKECDFSVHSANENTLKHNRFLLTGIKLSASSSLYPTSSSGSSTTVTTTSELKPAKTLTKRQQQQQQQPITTNSESIHQQYSNFSDHQYHNHTSDTSSVSTSSISEYLETLPGWHVEDLLDPSLNSFGLCKLMDQDVASNSMSEFSPETAWVPQCSPAGPQFSQLGVNFNAGFNDGMKAKSVHRIKNPYAKKTRHL